MNALLSHRPQSVLYPMMAMFLALTFLLLQGCVGVAQQADMKQTERAMLQRIKQQDEQISQARARQNLEISNLRERLEELEAKKGRPFEAVPDRPGKEVEAKVEIHDELISSLMVQIADLSKRLQTLEKR